MPPCTATETPTVRPIDQLIEALRSPLPQGFKWDFRQGSTCALGVANRIGVFSDVQDFRRRVFLSSDHDPFSADQIGGIVPLYGVPARDVTPAMVANALEKLVERAEG